MDRDDDEFLKVNANADYMAERLAEMIRNCMRAAVSGDPDSQTYKALQNFQALQKLIGFSDGVRGF